MRENFESAKNIKALYDIKYYYIRRWLEKGPFFFFTVFPILGLLRRK